MESSKVRIYGTVVSNEIPPVEMHRHKVETSKKKKIVDLKASGYDRPIDISWLKSASSKYCISPNIADYIVIPVPVITSGIPNRRCQSFSIASLLDFDTEYKRQRYSTFVGCPTYVEHKNDVFEEAKGINLDASLTYVPEYKLYKVNVLSAFDRTKYPDITDRIMRLKTNQFSMGAVCTTFRCSLCGNLLGPGVDRTCKCEGDYTELRSYGSVKNGKLHYISAVDPIFIENSWVADPADITAVGNPI